MNHCALTLTVLTFNSESFLTELLESLTQQAATDIQVIISDDCSTDNTLDIITNWKLIHENLFFEIVIIKSQFNTGVVENKKRTFKHIKGEWTKGIAGDDKLYPGAIKGIREDIYKFKDSKIIIGKALLVREKESPKIIIPKSEVINKLTSIDKIKNYLFEGNTIPAITFLVKSEILIKGDFFKKAKKNFEDVPFHLELLSNNIDFSFSENIYIIYQKHGYNLSVKKQNEILPQSYIDYQKILLIYARLNMKWIYFINILWNITLGFIIIKLGNKGRILKWINSFRRSLQPKRIKNMFIKPF